MPVLQRDAVYDLEQFEELLPASVTITRTSESDIKLRQLIVWLDGERVGELLWGDSVTRELEPGPHKLRVSNTLVWRTAEFVLGPGEQAFFETVNRMGPGSIFVMVVLLGIGPLYVSLRRMC